MAKLKDYTGIPTINLEVTLPAKSKKEALELLENICPVIDLSFVDEIPATTSWQDNIDTAEWELED